MTCCRQHDVEDTAHLLEFKETQYEVRGSVFECFFSCWYSLGAVAVCLSSVATSWVLATTMWWVTLPGNESEKRSKNAFSVGTSCVLGEATTWSTTQ
jgi:hypothetical protein